MTTYKELREISLSFRRLSSSFLNSTDSTASALIQRFKSYIDTTPFISTLIRNTISEVEYDYRDCFKKDVHGGWSEVVPPVDEACHVKAMYDYLYAIVEDGSKVLNAARSYYCSERKFTEIIRHFLDIAFKPLIDYINDAISKEMILVEEEKVTSITQNIEKVYGTVNQQGSGTIYSETHIYSAQVEQISELLGKILPSLDTITDLSEEALEDVRDDLQSIEEQIKSQSPKKSRLQKAVGGIKKFLGDFSMKLAVSLAASSVSQVDWEILINKVEEFIALL